MIKLIPAAVLAAALALSACVDQHDLSGYQPNEYCGPGKVFNHQTGRCDKRR